MYTSILKTCYFPNLWSFTFPRSWHVSYLLYNSCHPFFPRHWSFEVPLSGLVSSWPETGQMVLVRPWGDVPIWVHHVRTARCLLVTGDAEWDTSHGVSVSLQGGELREQDTLLFCVFGQRHLGEDIVTTQFSLFCSNSHTLWDAVFGQFTVYL